MQYLTVNDLITQPNEKWNNLSAAGETVITNEGRPCALLTPLGDNSLEEIVTAFRRAKGILALRKMQEISLACGNNRTSDDEIEAEISEARIQRQVKL